MQKNVSKPVALQNVAQRVDKQDLAQNGQKQQQSSNKLMLNNQTQIIDELEMYHAQMQKSIHLSSPLRHLMKQYNFGVMDQSDKTTTSLTSSSSSYSQQSSSRLSSQQSYSCTSSSYSSNTSNKTQMLTKTTSTLIYQTPAAKRSTLLQQHQVAAHSHKHTNDNINSGNCTTPIASITSNNAAYTLLPSLMNEMDGQLLQIIRSYYARKQQQQQQRQKREQSQQKQKIINSKHNFDTSSEVLFNTQQICVPSRSIAQNAVGDTTSFVATNDAICHSCDSKKVDVNANTLQMQLNVHPSQQQTYQSRHTSDKMQRKETITQIFSEAVSEKCNHNADTDSTIQEKSNIADKVTNVANQDNNDKDNNRKQSCEHIKHQHNHHRTHRYSKKHQHKETRNSSVQKVAANSEVRVRRRNMNQNKCNTVKSALPYVSDKAAQVYACRVTHSKLRQPLTSNVKDGNYVGDDTNSESTRGGNQRCANYQYNVNNITTNKHSYNNLNNKNVNGVLRHRHRHNTSNNRSTQNAFKPNRCGTHLTQQNANTQHFNHLYKQENNISSKSNHDTYQRRHRIQQPQQSLLQHQQQQQQQQELQYQSDSEYGQLPRQQHRPSHQRRGFADDFRLPQYSSTSFVRAYFGDIHLNAQPAVLVSGLAAALNMAVVLFLQHHVLDTHDHLGLFLIGSYLVFATYYMTYYFLERFSSSFRAITSLDRKFYVISNLLKAGIFVSITPFAFYHLIQMIIFDRWENNILRNLGCIYTVPDFIAILIVKRMRWSTWIHHWCVVAFNYFSIMNDYRNENVCRCVVVYAAFSSFAYCVNVLLASRFLGLPTLTSHILAYVALTVYALCCAVNWAWQAYYLHRLMTTGHRHWTVYAYMILISLVMWDDVVLTKWLYNNAQSSAFVMSARQQHQQQQQRQEQPMYENNNN